MSKICFASIDVEPVQSDFQNIEKTNEILNIFRNFEIPLTLFVCGSALKKFSDKAKERGRDSEIACHGFSHQFWSELCFEKRQQELDDFIKMYKEIYTDRVGDSLPKGFRAPSHLIDQEGLKLIETKGFLYDSSVLPHYPFLKRMLKPYRGFLGNAPLSPYYPNKKDYRKKGDMNILEIPVTGQLFGIPLVGSWLCKLPFFIYRLLFLFHTPSFLTLNIHSWDILDPRFLKNLAKILLLLKKKNYQFLTGEQIHDKFSKD